MGLESGQTPFGEKFGALEGADGGFGVGLGGVLTGLNLNGASRSGEIRIGFRTGWIRSIAIAMGGASVVGIGLGLLGLAERQPTQMFELLSRWGFVWLLALAAMVLLWDLAKLALGYLGKLADSVQDSAVAIGRLADRDDRERDRMITETAFIGQRLERMADELRADRAEQKAHNNRLEALMRSLNRNEGNGDGYRRGTE